jgi:RNA polymerase sigma-70 factor (ECF subfamily)
MNDVELADAMTRLLPRLWTFALRLIGDADLAEELVHRSCRAGLQRGQELRADTDVLLWLFTVLRSVWQSDIRFRAMRYSTAARRQDKAARQCRYRRIVDAVAGLPDLQRFALILVFVERVDVEGASEILALSVTAVMELLAQARLTIGSYFDPPA